MQPTFVTPFSLSGITQHHEAGLQGSSCSARRAFFGRHVTAKKIESMHPIFEASSVQMHFDGLGTTEVRRSLDEFSKSVFQNDALFFEYMSAANPKMPAIPLGSLSASLHKTGDTRVIPFDLSYSIQTPYPATSPNLLASYIRIQPNDNISTQPNASSQTFYIIRGFGHTDTEFGRINWKEGDVFVLPMDVAATHVATADTAMYWIHDEPLLNYLGARAVSKRFEPTLYTREQLMEEIERVRAMPGAKKRNRCGVLLGNSATPLTKTITHTQWCLMNIIMPDDTQKPHKHNSVALDMVISAGPNVYTLIGRKVDADGNIINPIRQEWRSGEVFITPPGLWHSHHNESGEPALILPMQDAGLHTYMRTLDIQFT